MSPVDGRTRCTSIVREVSIYYLLVQKRTPQESGFLGGPRGQFHYTEGTFSIA